MVLERDERPWGFYEVLCDEKDHKVKRITVAPGKRLSLQSHQRRSEHWYVLKGQARVTLGDRVIEVTAGQAVDIGLGIKHRVENPLSGELIFIEIQSGNYFGEDDIQRFEDDFGRV